MFTYPLKPKCILPLCPPPPQGWSHSNSQAGLKKSAGHEQDTLNKDYHLKSQNDTDSWNRPRCGVPDYPTMKTVSTAYFNGKKRRGGLSREQRRKRYALFGGRWEKTDLTYK